MVHAYDSRNAKSRRRGATDTFILTQYVKMGGATEPYGYCTRSHGSDALEGVAMPLPVLTVIHQRQDGACPAGRAKRHKAAPKRSSR
jgi:hypothetical protein